MRNHYHSTHHKEDDPIDKVVIRCPNDPYHTKYNDSTACSNSDVGTIEDLITIDHCLEVLVENFNPYTKSY